MTIPLFKIWGQLGYEPLIFSCTIMKRHDESPMTFFLTMGFVLPCIAMTFCYSRIYWKVRQVGNLMRNQMDQDVTDGVLNRHMKRRERAITKTTLWVWLAYVICMMPSTLIMIFDPMPPNKDHPGLHVAGYIVFWCSGFINPVIYIVSNRNYRKNLQSELCCSPPQEDNSEMDSTERPSSTVTSFLSRFSNSRASNVSYSASRKEMVDLNPNGKRDVI